MIGPTDRRWLRSKWDGHVRFEEPMSRHTTLKVGGPAEVLAAPESLTQLKTLIRWCGRQRVPVSIIGSGSNLLVSDAGIAGVVVILTKGFNRIKALTGPKGICGISAMAGARLATVCRRAIGCGLAGLAFAIGIPGTVGAAVMGNVGTPTGSMAQIVNRLQVLRPIADEGRPQIQTIERDRLDFSYRCLQWPPDWRQPDNAQWPPMIVAVELGLQPEDPTSLKRQADAILSQRKQAQPYGSASAGCFFKNPPAGPTAGELIDRAGLKGKTIGGAMVSPRHANFLVNRGGATARDFHQLIEHVHQIVLQTFGVHLETEVRIVGS